MSALAASSIATPSAPSRPRGSKGTRTPRQLRLQRPRQLPLVPAISSSGVGAACAKAAVEADADLDVRVRSIASHSRREALAAALAVLAGVGVQTPLLPARAAEDDGDAVANETAKKPPRELVIGATGQTGSLVVDELRRRGGAEVVAAVRSAEKAKKMGVDAGGVGLLPGFDVTGGELPSTSTSPR